MRTEMRKIIGAQLFVVQEDNGIIYHDLGDFRGDINMYIILYIMYIICNMYACTINEVC